MPLIDARGAVFAGRTPARRVVSLVPSTTHTVLALGAGASLVGVTRYCALPDGVDAQRVGGTKAADVARIAALRPDLILTNCEEATAGLIQRLDAVAPTWAAFPKDLDAAARDVADTAALLGVDPSRVLDDIVRARRRPPARRLRVAWMIWRGPYMAAGADTFLSAMLDAVGCDNALAHLPGRYPQVETAELAAADPDVVCLSSEPFSFTDAHADELAAATGLPRARVRFADGRLSWHGAFMAHSLRALLPDPLHAWTPSPP